MTIQLIQGDFEHTEALDLLTQMIQVKIKYHETKINGHLNEEDIKFREGKIKKLQDELMQVRQFLSHKDKQIHIEAKVNMA
ncbi:MAG: hypothetical protein KGK14_04380 [Bacteroidota bacterium]|jgi:hypothetical protein|nr:hypothetical protein [Bacteroidota bacterium]